MTSSSPLQTLTFWMRPAVSGGTCLPSQSSSNKPSIGPLCFISSINGCRSSIPGCSSLLVSHFVESLGVSLNACLMLTPVSCLSQSEAVPPLAWFLMVTLISFVSSQSVPHDSSFFPSPSSFGATNPAAHSPDSIRWLCRSKPSSCPLQTLTFRASYPSLVVLVLPFHDLLVAEASINSLCFISSIMALSLSRPISSSSFLIQTLLSQCRLE